MCNNLVMIQPDCERQLRAEFATAPDPWAMAPTNPWTAPPARSARRPARHRVAVLALPGVIAFELGLPHRFLCSDAFLPGWPGPVDGDAPYETQVCTADNGPVVTSAGYAVLPTADNSIMAAADTIIIPGFIDRVLTETHTLPTDLAALLDSAKPGVRWVSICTGAFVLAAFGLLDGLPATTHWAHADKFAELFPRVLLDPNVLFVDNPPSSHNRLHILTSAGNAAGIDLLLHLVRSDHGSAVANRIARSAVVAPWRDGGQAQFINHPMPRGTSGRPNGAGDTAATRQWVLENLSSGIDLAGMAGRAGMSVRTFTRRFRGETGETAGTWLTRMKVDRARHLLESTDLPVDRVADRAGFGTTASTRQQLSAAVGLSPMSYRRRFRADPSSNGSQPVGRLATRDSGRG